MILCRNTERFSKEFIFVLDNFNLKTLIGKIYDQWENIDENFSSDDITDCKDVYLVEDIINQIDDILYDVNNIING